MSNITVEYGEFLIFYWEYDNTWVPKRSSGNLPGCTSLAKAKESIDNLTKQEKATFIRHKAIYIANDYSDPIKVEVTCFVNKNGKLFAWIKMSDGNRRCENVDTLRALTDENADRLLRLEKLKKDCNILREESQAIRNKIIRICFETGKTELFQG